MTLVTAAGQATHAPAAEWYLSSRASQQISYDDNIGLNTRNSEKVSEFGETSSIGLTGGGRTPTVDIHLDSLFNFTQFPDYSRLNSNDQYITLSSTYTGERLSVGLTGQYIRDTTRTSDVESTGLFILQNRRREVLRVAPKVAYQLTPVDEVSVTGDLSDTSYPSGNIRDFKQWGGTGSWTHDLSERTQILASASGFKVNSNDAGAQNTNYYSALFGVRHVFSDRLRASLTAGPTLTDASFTFASDGVRRSEDDVTLGYGFDGSVEYRYQERLSFQGRAYRTVAPDPTTGVVTEQTGIRIASTYQVLRNLFFDTAALYLLREDVGQGRTSVRRDYVYFEPTLRWRLAEDWDLRTSYRFRWQTFDRSDGNSDAHSNAVFASITYRLPPLTMSR